MATTNGSTAIRDKILASLARYRALRIGKFPCAFWRLSSRPGLTALEVPNKIIQAISSKEQLLVPRQLTKRKASAHKGLFGHVLVVGGGYGYAGAVHLAAEAALNSGAGLVSVAPRKEHALQVHWVRLKNNVYFVI